MFGQFVGPGSILFSTHAVAWSVLSDQESRILGDYPSCLQQSAGILDVDPPLVFGESQPLKGPSTSSEGIWSL